jgi:Fur family ferric uptake transcriptional regulator
LRATPARIAILSFLNQTDEPSDVKRIIGHLNKEKIKTDPATVFRIMNILIEKGIITEVYFDDGKARYEMADRKHHHHLVCESCGRIQDISSDPALILEKEIVKRYGFLVKRHSLEFFGVCVNCQK